jgi:hypothetical protein
LAPQIDFSALSEVDKTIFLTCTKLLAPELLAEARATRFLSVDT